MAPPAKILNRIKAELKRKPAFERPYVAFHPTDPRFIEGVFCKCCGRKIRGLVPHEQYQDRLILVCLPGYEEITIEFDDGSAHVTPICSDCAVNLNEDDLESLYAADLQEFLRAEEKGGGAVKWEMYATRKPVRYRRGA